MDPISLHNYEVYFIDFFDGQLNALQTAELMEFLEKYPNKKSEFDTYDSIQIPLDSIKFSEKNSIYNGVIEESISINENNYEDYIIAKNEKLINNTNMIALNSFIETDPLFQKTEQIYAATILLKDKIEFPDKEKLLKKVAVLPLLTYFSAAAAVLFFFFLMYFPSTSYEYKELAKREFDNYPLMEQNNPYMIANSSEDMKKDEKIGKVVGNSEKTIKKGSSVAENSANNSNANNNSSNLALIVANVDESKKDTLNGIIPITTIAETDPNKIAEIDRINDSIIENTVFQRLGKTELVAMRNANMEMIDDLEDDDEIVLTILTPDNLNDINKDKGIEYASLTEAAKGITKTEVLKNKSLIEVLASEITNSTNNKIKITAKKEIDKKLEMFALEIGSFSFSKKF